MKLKQLFIIVAFGLFGLSLSGPAVRAMESSVKNDGFVENLNKMNLNSKLENVSQQNEEALHKTLDFDKNEANKINEIENSNKNLECLLEKYKKRCSELTRQIVDNHKAYRYAEAESRNKLLKEERDKLKKQIEEIETQIKDIKTEPESSEKTKVLKLNDSGFKVEKPVESNRVLEHKTDVKEIDSEYSFDDLKKEYDKYLSDFKKMNLKFVDLVHKWQENELGSSSLIFKYVDYWFLKQCDNLLNNFLSNLLDCGVDYLQESESLDKIRNLDKKYDKFFSDFLKLSLENFMELCKNKDIYKKLKVIVYPIVKDIIDREIEPFNSSINGQMNKVKTYVDFLTFLGRLRKVFDIETKAGGFLNSSMEAIVSKYFYKVCNLGVFELKDIDQIKYLLESLENSGGDVLKQLELVSLLENLIKSNKDESYNVGKLKEEIRKDFDKLLNNYKSGFGCSFPFDSIEKNPKIFEGMRELQVEAVKVKMKCLLLENLVESKFGKEAVEVLKK